MKTAGRAEAPFELRYRNGAGDKTIRADAVIDASGTWFSPNPAGASGLPAFGEDAERTRIAYGMPDVLGAERGRYADKRVAVLGAGHSAVGTLIDLAALAEAAPGTEIVWLMRGDNPAKSFGGGVNDKLVERGALGVRLARWSRRRIQVETGFRLTHIGATAARLRLGAGSSCCGREVVADELIVATGFRPSSVS